MSRVGIALALLCYAEITLAQAVSPGNLIHSVADVQKSVAFYRALGLQPAGSHLTIPGESFGLELKRLGTTDTRSRTPRMQDVGTARLVISVRNLDVIFAAATKAGAAVVSAGGSPVLFPTSGGGATRAVTVLDADGFFIELLQLNPLPTTSAPADSNVVGGRIAITVDDVDRTVAFYRDVLSFDVKSPSKLGPNENVMKLFGMPGARWRYAMANVPGSSASWELAEFRDIVQERVSKANGAAFSVVVRDAKALAKNVKSAGGEIVSADPLRFRDMNGFLIELIERR